MSGAAYDGPVTKVELYISCTDLVNKDTFSKSDPFAVLFETKPGLGQKGWMVGKTEVIYDNLNPKFTKTFAVDYRFEEVQHFKVVIYDLDDKVRPDDLEKHDFLGLAEFKLADVLTAGKCLTKKLMKYSGSQPAGGCVHITGEEMEESKFDINMKMYAKKLDKKDFFGKSDPFVEIGKAQTGGTLTVVYRSQPIMKTLDPIWNEFTMPMQKLCNGDWDRELQFSVYDWNKSGDHELIGSAWCNLRDIIPEKGGRITQLELINPKIKVKKGHKYHNSGILAFHHIRAIAKASFVDYIKGGCELNLIVAIDFTGSNGKPTNPNSLHYNNPYKDNNYVAAIKSVATILADYDSDQQFPSFGFGAKAHQFKGVSHCFPLNFNFSAPEVIGVQGILDAYHYTVGQVEFYGPTNFSSILDKAMEYATHPSQDVQRYQILMIITDGVITDMADTIDRIVQASNLPLSIVIVGVGAADFSAMEVLDADDNPLRDRHGTKMARDIVQFVPLRNFNTQGADFSLARETLAEIPIQFLSYMSKRGIKPNPPVTRPFSQQQQQPPYPAAPNTAPYPTQQPPYPVPQPGSAPYPTNQSAPYPSRPAPYPTQPVTNPTAPYPSGQSAPYPNQSAPYPSQSAPYPSQTAPYPTQPVPNPTGPQTANL